MKKLLNFTTFMLMWCILHTSVAMGADLTVKADVLNSNTPSRTKIDVKKNLDLQTTGGLYLPSGTTAQQPVPYKDGMFRYNSTEGTAELFANGLWGPVGGSTSIADWNGGNDYETGDFVIQSLKLYRALLDHTASGSFPTDLANGDWEEISAGITAIGSIADNRIARFDGTTGELIQSSTAVLDDSGNLSGINNIGVAGNASVAGTTTLNTSLTGFLKGTSGLVSSVSAIDLSLDVVGTLPINRGGTGSTSQSWVDLTSNQGGIAGNKTFTGNLSTSGTMLASNLSGTNTGDLITGGTTGSTTVTNTLKTPFRQVTPTATGVVDIETGNSNELINPRFQATTYNDGWTCSIGTMSQGVGPDGSKALSVVSAGSGFRCRQTFTSSADLKGTLARFYARIKTAAPDVKICGLDGGILTANEVGCVTVNPTNANKVFDDPSGFFRYGDTLYGIVIYTNNAAVFPTVIDDASMGAAGLTTATIGSDVTNWVSYTPLWTASTTNPTIGNGTITGKWRRVGDSMEIQTLVQFGSTSTKGSGFYLLSIPSGHVVDVSRLPNSSTLAHIGTGQYISQLAVTASQVQSAFLENTTTFKMLTDQNATSNLFASTQSNVFNATGDNWATSIKVPIVGWSAVPTSGILSSNADFGPIPVTYTLTNAGNATITGTISRKGSTGFYYGKITIGSTLPTAQIAVNFPSIYYLSSTANRFLAGTASTTASGGVRVGAISSGSLGTNISFYNDTASLNGWGSGSLPATFTAGQIIEFSFSDEVRGWTQSPLAIIPLAGTSTTPGYSGQVDDIVFGYGATSSSICSTGTCAFLKQKGDAVVSVANTGLGAYLVTTKKTYSDIFCTGSVNGANYSNIFVSAIVAGSAFTMQTGAGVSNANTYGTVFCKGYY